MSLRAHEESRRDVPTFVSASGNGRLTVRWDLPSTSQRELLPRHSGLSQRLADPSLGTFSVVSEPCVVRAHFSSVWTPAEADVSCQNAMSTSSPEPQLPGPSQPVSLSGVLGQVRKVPQSTPEQCLPHGLFHIDCQIPGLRPCLRLHDKGVFSQKNSFPSSQILQTST